MMDHPRASRSSRDNSACVTTNPVEATALMSRVQVAMVKDLVNELRDHPSGAALSHHLGLPEEGDILNNLVTWCSNPDSTVFVLQAVLKSIGREDLAAKLLRKMQSMPLCVMIKEQGPSETTSSSQITPQPRFEMVMTSCDTDLASALKEGLGVDPSSCYQIVGPGDWVSWSTKAGDLRGKQLTLQHRNCYYSPKKKTDQSIYGLNSCLVGSNKDAMEKWKVCPSGETSSESPNTHLLSTKPSPTHGSDKRRATTMQADADQTIKKRPNTLPFHSYNITSNEDGSPMMEDQKSPLELTLSPTPISPSDASNITPFNTNDLLCQTPDTEESLAGHRSSYPVIVSPSVASGDEVEYSIDEHTGKKVPVGVQKIPHLPQPQRSVSLSASNHPMLDSYSNTRLSRVVLPIVSPTNSSIMDNVENINEILPHFSPLGLTPSSSFDGNPISNALNNLNSSSQTNLKELPQSSDSNPSTEVEDVDPKTLQNLFHVNNSNVDLVLEKGKGRNIERYEMMELDSTAQSSNITSTCTLAVTQEGRPTSGDDESSCPQSADTTLTDHSRSPTPPFGGMSPTEYVPHHALRQLSTPSNFADRSFQSVSFEDTSNNINNHGCNTNTRIGHAHSENVNSSNDLSVENSSSNNNNNNNNNGTSSSHHPHLDLTSYRLAGNSISPNNQLSDNDQLPFNNLSQSGGIGAVTVLSSNQHHHHHQQQQQKQHQRPYVPPIFQAPPPPPYPPPPYQPQEQPPHQPLQPTLHSKELQQLQQQQRLVIHHGQQQQSPPTLPPPQQQPQPPQQRQQQQQQQQSYHQAQPHKVQMNYQLLQQHQQQQQNHHHQQQQQFSRMTTQSHISPTRSRPYSNPMVHTPCSSEENIAIDAEPPPYLDVLACCNDMELRNINEPFATNRQNDIANHQHVLRNPEVLRVPITEHSHPPDTHIWKQHPNNGAHQTPPTRLANQFSDPVKMSDSNSFLEKTTNRGGNEYNINIISSPDSTRRALPVGNVLMYNTQDNTRSIIQASSFPVSGSNRLPEMNGNRCKDSADDDDTYLTACDPPYSNTNNVHQHPTSSKSLPTTQLQQQHQPPQPPPIPPPPFLQIQQPYTDMNLQPHFIQPLHHHNNNHHHHQLQHQPENPHQQHAMIHNSSSGFGSDEENPRYNYIDNAGVISSTGRDGLNGGSSATRYLPNDRTASSATHGSPIRRPTIQAPATPNAMSLEDQLSKVEGWMRDETDLTIEGTMEDYRCENGTFIVWRSQERDQFIITVSHNRVLNHFRVEEERIGNTDRKGYYVFDRGFRSESFLELVNHYIQSGIKQPKVDTRMGGDKAYDVIHIRLLRPLRARIVRRRQI